MINKHKISTYGISKTKMLLDYVLVSVMFIASLPLFFSIAFLIVVSSGFPVFFKQKRIGQNGMSFTIFKFRTMTRNADKLKPKFKSLNQADGPVFKIYNDPRFTKIGRFLSRTGMDELPQFFNILKGDMSLVGPRPLPVSEARKLTKQQKVRELVKPGIISTWVTHGSHNLRFTEWMLLDREYVKNATLATDMTVIKDALIMVIKNVLNILK